MWQWGFVFTFHLPKPSGVVLFRIHVLLLLRIRTGKSQLASHLLTGSFSWNNPGTWHPPSSQYQRRFALHCTLRSLLGLQGNLFADIGFESNHHFINSTTMSWNTGCTNPPVSHSLIESSLALRALFESPSVGPPMIMWMVIFSGCGAQFLGKEGGDGNSSLSTRRPSRGSRRSSLQSFCSSLASYISR